MRSGKGGFSWDSLKALTVTLNLLINWVPQWTASPAEYRELGKACFGVFGLLLGFNLVSAVAAILLVTGVFLEARKALQGLLTSPCEVFRRSPGTAFLIIMLIVPLAFALVRGRPFHARYGLVLLPPLLALAGAASARWLASPRLGRAFSVILCLKICSDVWFMPMLFRHQGMRIEQGGAFVPSFRKLETVYRQLKAHARGQWCVVEDKSYFEALTSAEKSNSEAKHIKYYVSVREKESGPSTEQQGPAVRYRLCRANEVTPGDPRVAYIANGIALVAQNPGRE